MLIQGLDSDDERRRIDAAAGIMNYYLAAEIGQLLQMMMTPVASYTPSELEQLKQAGVKL